MPVCQWMVEIMEVKNQLPKKNSRANFDRKEMSSAFPCLLGGSQLVSHSQLVSPPFRSHEFRPFGRVPTTPVSYGDTYDQDGY